MDRSYVRFWLLTGIAMGDEAESGSLLRLHIGSVVLIGIGIVVALTFGDALAILRSAKDLLIFDRTDISFLATTVKHPGHRGHTHWGKFNVGQNLAWSLLGSLAAVIVTGKFTGQRVKAPLGRTLRQ